MSDKINGEFILNSLSLIFNNKLKQILTDISVTYNINLDSLVSKHCDENISISDLALTIKKKKRKKNRVLDKNELCMAKKADGHQCTRRRKDGNEYCGKHLNNLKFGRIDDDDKYNDTNKYIKTTREKIDGIDYLVDSNNTVYSFDKNNPTIIGQKIQGKLVLLKDM
tara:strand:+ start:1462 stop:1962 length:501 start_codon:yes stop_codon:yes gene_type:complete